MLFGFIPDAAAHILDILLNNTFLPARSHIAEIRIEQVMCRHGKETRIDHTPVAFGHLVHGGLHVVVNAAGTPPKAVNARVCASNSISWLCDG